MHVLVVMSRRVRVSITSDGPQETLAPRVVPLFLSLFCSFFTSFSSAPGAGHETACAQESWRVAGSIIL